MFILAQNVWLTDCRVLVLGLSLEVFGIEMRDFSLLFWLISVDVQRFLVENVFGDIVSELLVGSEGIEMLQRLYKPGKMVVDLKLTSSFGQLL